MYLLRMHNKFDIDTLLMALVCHAEHDRPESTEALMPKYLQLNQLVQREDNFYNAQFSTIRINLFHELQVSDIFLNHRI